MKRILRKKSLEFRLLSKIVIIDDCWHWDGCRNEWQYGKILVNKKCKMAHRVAYEVWNGAIPIGKIIMHTCDCPPCINPQHLKIGTDLENSQDMYRKKRSKHFSGQENKNSKLTNNIVSKIKNEIKNNPYYGQLADLAREHKISYSVIKKIKRGENWKHIK